MTNAKSDYKNLPCFLSHFKIEEIEFENEYNNWLAENPDLPFNDFMWKFFEKTAIRIAKESQTEHELYHKLAAIYREMTFFKVKVERVNGNDFLADAHRYDLLSQKASGYKMNVIFIGPSKCKKCKSIKYVK